MNCVRTKRHVWLAGPDLVGSILDGALSSIRSAGKPCKNRGRKERLQLYIERRRLGMQNSAVICD